MSTECNINQMGVSTNSVNLASLEVRVRWCCLASGAQRRRRYRRAPISPCDATGATPPWRKPGIDPWRVLESLARRLGVMGSRPATSSPRRRCDGQATFVGALTALRRIAVARYVQPSFRDRPSAAGGQRPLVRARRPLKCSRRSGSLSPTRRGSRMVRNTQAHGGRAWPEARGTAQGPATPGRHAGHGPMNWTAGSVTWTRMAIIGAAEMASWHQTRACAWWA